MHAVIFEVWVKPDKLDDYLEIATALRKDLETIDGFISIERFSSIVNEGKMVSISYWRDEAAIAAWREQSKHQKAQLLGRADIFADYSLKVAEVVRDYGMTERDQAPQDLPPPGGK